MANEQRDTRNAAAPPNAELDELAFRIYSQKAASHSARRGGDREAIDAYKQAEAFLAVRAKVRAGEMKTVSAAEDLLADCSAPNLPETHPLNLVSRRFGDIAKVRRINDWLEKNPTPERDTEELVSRFRRAFPEVNWSAPSHGEALAVINVARAVFPVYCTARN